MFKYLKNLVTVAVVFAITACSSSKTEDEPTPPPVEPSVVNTTVLVYMAASNSLGVQKNDSMDIREMQQAARLGHFNGNRLLVYHAGYLTTPTLSEVKADGSIVRLARYDNDTLSSVHAARMKKVIADARKTAPSNTFGLVLWSHGDGWLQNGLVENSLGEDTSKGSLVHKPQVAGWGVEHSQKMKITTLAKVLEQSQPIDFLYFDCCYMNSVEVAYELRHAVPYIVGSVIELPAEGMPYQKTLKYLFKSDGPDLVAAAQCTFDHFDALLGDARTCAMSVINTAGLDSLAAQTKRVYENTSLANVKNYKPQAYMTSSTCYFYDLADYIYTRIGSDDPDLAADWEKAFNDVVIYSDSTPLLWNRLNLSRCNGLSTYLFKYNSSSLPNQYNSLSWYRDVATWLIPE